MRGTLSVFSAETYRLARSPVALASALFLMILAALRVVAARAADAAAHARAVQQALADNRSPPDVPALGNAYAPLVDGWVTGLTVGTLLLVIHGARTVASDRRQGLLRLASTRSVTRGGLVLGRVLLGLPLCLAVVALSGLGAWLAADQLFAFGPLVEYGYELKSAEELDAELWRSVLATVPPLLATWTFALAVSSACRTPAGAVGGALAAYLGFDLFKDVLGQGQYWVFAAFNPSFVDRSAMHEMAGVARGLSDAGYTEALLRMNLTLPWPQALLLVALACWIVSRRSL